MALFGWMIVVLPFIWVFFPLTRPERAKDFYLYAFLLEKKMLYFFIGFFALIFFSFLIISFVLTRWNNRNLYRKVNKSFEYEDEELKKDKNYLKKCIRNVLEQKKREKRSVFILSPKRKSRYDTHCRFV